LASDLPATTAIVILNWNGRPFLEKFLPGVLAHSGGCRIVVADNASQDDSVAYVRQHFPTVELIVHARNLGFCEGYNQALRQIAADYYVLLNSDVEVTPNWTRPILALMAANPQVAACQPKIKSYHHRAFFEYAGAGGGFIDHLGYPFCRGRLFETLEEDQGQYDDTVPVFWATGACMFLRAAAFHQVGGLEPAFFAHMEEIDLCWRLQQQGFHILYCGQSQVYHVGGGTLPKTNSRKTFLNFRNGFAMLYKNIAPEQFYTVIPIRILLDWVAAFKFMTDGDFKSALAVFKAHAHCWRHRKYWRAQRRKQPALHQHLEGVYPGSVVWDHFIKGKKHFRELEIPDRAPLPA
jgi:GT2 family glycosyltransferase